MDELLSASGSAVKPPAGARAPEEELTEAEPFLANTEALLASHHADLMRGDAAALSEHTAHRAAHAEKPFAGRNGHLPNGRLSGETRAADRRPDALPVPTGPLRVKPPLHPGARQNRNATPVAAREQPVNDEKKPLSIGRFCHECGGQYPIVEARFCSFCGARRAALLA